MSARPVKPKLNPARRQAGADAPAIDGHQRSSFVERFFNSRLRLSQLRVLAAIAEFGRLRHVADALNVTPPAVSKQIAEIEESLRGPIVRRVGNRVEFTPLGELLSRRARDVLAQIDRVRMEVDELISGVPASIGIGTVPTVAPLFVPMMVATLRDKAPNVSIRVHEHQFDQLAPLLRDGVIDIAIARETAHRMSPVFVEQQIMSDPLAIVCGAQYKPKKRSRLSWKDLHGMPWILPARGSSTFVHLESLLFRNGLTVPVGSMETNSRGAMVGLLQSQPFLALLPSSYVAPYLRSGVLFALPLSTQGAQGMIKMVCRKDDASPLVALLSEALRRHAQRIGAAATPD